jgi:hypothetical protein
VDHFEERSKVVVGEGIEISATKKQKEVTDIGEWGQLMRRLIRAYAIFFPNLFSKHMGFHDYVMDMHLEKRYLDRALFDYARRVRLAFSGLRAGGKWYKHDMRLVTQCLHSRGGDPSPAHRPRSDGRKSDAHPQPCHAWQNGKVCTRSKCNFRHFCVVCDGKPTHNPSACPKRRAR